MFTTPKFAFKGGPLDGQRIDKTIPGRWPFALDATGTKMRTDAYYRQTYRTGYPDLYQLGESHWEDGTQIRTYEWQGK